MFYEILTQLHVIASPTVVCSCIMNRSNERDMFNLKINKTVPGTGTQTLSQTNAFCFGFYFGHNNLKTYTCLHDKRLKLQVKT